MPKVRLRNRSLGQAEEAPSTLTRQARPGPRLCAAKHVKLPEGFFRQWFWGKRFLHLALFLLFVFQSRSFCPWVDVAEPTGIRNDLINFVLIARYMVLVRPINEMISLDCVNDDNQRGAANRADPHLRLFMDALVTFFPAVVLKNLARFHF
jgi:hypothetical protein